MACWCVQDDTCDECAIIGPYTPKVGDRVRVTYEGTIDWVSRNGFVFTIGDNDHVELNTKGAEIEKLQDPEPDWVNGDVVEVVYERTVPGNPHGPRLVARIGGKWRLADTGEITGPYFMRNHWPDNVKILHKHTA